MNNFNFIDSYRKMLILKQSLSPIALHDNILSKYVMVLLYYPMKDSKANIYLKLNKNQRVGMLNRHILSVANKLDVYQVIIKELIELRDNYKKYKKYKEKGDINNFWTDHYKETEKELSRRYVKLLDIIIEEITRRENPKYLRKKKLKEIKNNLQN